MKAITFLLFLPILSFGQLSTEVNKLYQKLSKSTRVESKNISVDGRESEIYALYDNIAKIATDKEVEYLSFNGNTIGKAYFSNLMFTRKSPSLLKLFNFYLSNNETFKQMAGCVVFESSLADDLYKKIFWGKKSNTRFRIV